MTQPSSQRPQVRTVAPLVRYHSAERCTAHNDRVVQPLPALSDIQLILGIAGCSWLFLALASFNSADQSFFSIAIPMQQPLNWCGSLGAQITAWLFVVCGQAGAWFLGLLSTHALLVRERLRVHQTVIKWFAALCLLTSISTFCSIVSFGFCGGGVIGSFFAQHLMRVGIFGAALTASVIFLLAAHIFARITVRESAAVVLRYSKIAFGFALLVGGLVADGIRVLIGKKRKEEEKPLHEKPLTEIPETEQAENAASCSIEEENTNQTRDTQAWDTQTWEAELVVPQREKKDEQHRREKDDEIAQAAPAQILLAEEAEGDDNDDDNSAEGEGDLVQGGGAADESTLLEIEEEIAEEEEAESGADDEQAALAEAEEPEEIEEWRAPLPFVLPPLRSIFDASNTQLHDNEFLNRCQERARILEEKLMHFGISGRVCNVEPGPIITLFEYEPEVGNKVSKILALEDDLALSLKALSIRILAPIPGKSVVGFEIANEKRSSVMFGDVVGDDGLSGSRAHLPLALGVDIVGNPVIGDLATMPHLLVAGATGAGKSVGMNVMLVSLLARCTPDKVRIILIDPKRLEFTPYADIPHLLFPIVTNPHEVAPVLKWVAGEMELRYELMAQLGVRNIAEYHKLNQADCFAKEREIGIHVHGMPYITIMIDELADLMMVGGREIEMLIARIAQMARAAGIHMIVATQRPSVDVVTGLIKANFPSRIAFRVSSKIDSRTIIDNSGAEKLLGRGDMLYMSPSNMGGVQRLHGAYVTDAEIDRLTEYLKTQRPASYFSLKQVVADHSETDEDYDDPLYTDVCEFIQSVDEISISLLQRKYRVGFNRSARLIEMLERDGRVAAAQGGKPRRVLRE